MNIDYKNQAKILLSAEALIEQTQRDTREMRAHIAKLSSDQVQMKLSVEIMKAELERERAGNKG